MESIDYSIANDTLNSKIIKFNLIDEIENDLTEMLTKFEINGDIITIYFNQALSEFDAAALDFTINNHTGEPYPKPKILNMVSDEIAKLGYADIDYTIHTTPKLHPKRYLIHGELQKTEWYRDNTEADLILTVENVYIRDPFGSAVTRDTSRKWIREDETLTDPITRPKSYSSLEQIQEGKRRRGNVVDGIQLPIMAMMLEVLGGTYEDMEILFIGRDFLDRHEDYFNKFVKNSSTETDINSPNFGLKKVVIQIKLSANTTDPWLKLNPLQLDPTGNTSIEDFMVSEFTI